MTTMVVFKDAQAQELARVQFEGQLKIVDMAANTPAVAEVVIEQDGVPVSVTRRVHPLPPVLDDTTMVRWVEGVTNVFRYTPERDMMLTLFTQGSAEVLHKGEVIASGEFAGRYGRLKVRLDKQEDYLFSITSRQTFITTNDFMCELILYPGESFALTDATTSSYVDVPAGKTVTVALVPAGSSTFDVYLNGEADPLVRDVETHQLSTGVYQIPVASNWQLGAQAPTLTVSD